jgi:hypothetical protein
LPKDFKSMQTDQPQLVEKEEIASFDFPAIEILEEEEDIIARNLSIKRAISLGNLEHQKVAIYFSDASGYKKVETTIWAVGEKFIVLKQNVTIPINRIHKLEV